MQLGESMEDYLEAILVLSKCLDHVRSVDVASYLGFSKPSVSHAVKLLSEQGLIVLDVSKFLTLSEEGKKIAEETYFLFRYATKYWCTKKYCDRRCLSY